MDRKDLIQRYLDAETTAAEERALADSFAVNPPSDEQEMAVSQMLKEVKPVQLEELPDATEEFDRILARSRMRSFRRWGIPLVGIAAAVVAVVLFTGRPSGEVLPQPSQPELVDLLHQLAIISSFDPADADNYEFKPVGDGFVMTAHFPDGQTASYILTPLDGGDSFNLIALNH